MTADSTLLELAARAYGGRVQWEDGVPWFVGAEPGVECEWNPLDDDGDALRLAVALRLTLSWDRYDDDDYATATPPYTHQGYDCIVDQDPRAAIRRTIVLAAAAIGRKLP